MEKLITKKFIDGRLWEDMRASKKISSKDVEEFLKADFPCCIHHPMSLCQIYIDNRWYRIFKKERLECLDDQWCFVGNYDDGVWIWLPLSNYVVVVAEEAVHLKRSPLFVADTCSYLIRDVEEKKIGECEYEGKSREYFQTTELFRRFRVRRNTLTAYEDCIRRTGYIKNCSWGWKSVNETRPAMWLVRHEDEITDFSVPKGK